MENLKLAVVGAGIMGRRHIMAISTSAESYLVGIADPDPAAQRVADAQAVRRFDDVSQLIEEQRPDGLIIATPTQCHLRDSIIALDAGIPVLIEKPIAPTCDEALLIAKRAAATGSLVLVGHHRRYYPVIQRASEVVRCGVLGRLVGVNGQWSVFKDDSYFQPEYRKLRPAGPVLTNLIHELDSLRVICGEIASVSAETDSSSRGFEKEDTAVILVRFDSGALGSFLLSDVTPSPWTWEQATGENQRYPTAGQNTHRFIGTRGSLEFPDLVLWRQASGKIGWHYPIQPEPMCTIALDAYAAQCAHFCAVVRGQETPRTDVADATKTLAATIAVFRSAEAGKRVVL